VRFNPQVQLKHVAEYLYLGERAREAGRLNPLLGGSQIGFEQPYDVWQQRWGKLEVWYR
jgi:hypothetical protein